MYMPFWFNGLTDKWDGLDPVDRFNQTSRMAADTLTDRPKSVRNRCVVEAFGGVFVLHLKDK